MEQEFHAALRRYLISLKPVPPDKPLNGDESGGSQIRFITTSDGRNLQLATGAKDWFDFLVHVETIFDARIGRAVISWAIDRELERVEERDFPFNEHTIEVICRSVYNQVIPHYQHVGVALVPLHNLIFRDQDDVQLANSVLVAEKPTSELANQLNRLGDRIPDPRNSPFLRIPVSGDQESQRRQAIVEASKSLAALRFVTMWSTKSMGHREIMVNSAADVDFREKGKQRFIYYDPDRLEKDPTLTEAIANQHFLNAKRVGIAKDFYGLDDINYHYGQEGRPISRRIVTALDLYDSGVLASSNWQAVYRYVASTNVVMPTSSSGANDLTEQLTTLIEFGGSYVGTMIRDGTESPPKEEDWDELVRRTAEPFAQFYRIRNDVLHGNEKRHEISDRDVQYVRTLAHNAIRLMASLAIEFKWSSYKEAKEWFRNPTRPPSSDRVE